MDLEQIDLGNIVGAIIFFGGVLFILGAVLLIRLRKNMDKER